MILLYHRGVSRILSTGYLISRPMYHVVRLFIVHIFTYFYVLVLFFFFIDCMGCSKKKPSSAMLIDFFPYIRSSVFSIICRNYIFCGCIISFNLLLTSMPCNIFFMFYRDLQYTRCYSLLILESCVHVDDSHDSRF